MAQTLKPEKREAILTAARARFRKYGIKETTMNQIAEDAGLAVGNLYRYFANKMEIIAACADQFAQKHQEQIEKIQASKLDWFTKLETYVLARFAASQEVRTGISFASEIARAVIEAKPHRLKDESTMFAGLIKSCLDKAATAGQFSCEDADMEAKIFCYAVAFFFPVSGNVVVVEPTEDELLKVLAWFKKRWTQSA